MNLLFIHPNVSGQFKFLAPGLAARGHTVVAMTMQKTEARTWQGVTCAARARLGHNARAFVQANDDLQTVYLPGQLVWVEGLVT